MAVYRQVYITFWQDQFILDLTPEEKYFYLYLMTNSKTKQCGCYQIPKKVMELETGYNRETIDKLLQRFIDYKKIVYCEETSEVLLVNWLKYNPINNINIKKCVNRELGEVKSLELKEALEGLVRAYDTPTKKKEKEKEKEKAEEEATATNQANLSPHEKDCLNTLRAVENYPFDFAKDLDMLRIFMLDYPEIDILTELKKWRDYKRDKPLIKNKSSPRAQLRNWMIHARKFMQERGDRSNGETRRGHAQSDPGDPAGKFREFVRS